jgi:uncharacterized protein (TIGR00375 family)
LLTENLEDAFEELTPYVRAVETGLSSDPIMNWRLSALDNITLISNSDAHSLPKLGREANVFNFDSKKDITYTEIKRIIDEKDKKKFLYTLEFFPEEGKYYLDGHRDCKFSCLPPETKKLKNICPICHKPLVVGVLNRVEELADRKSAYKPLGAVPFIKLVELDKIIAEVLGVKNRNSKRVQKEYLSLIQEYGSELEILLNLNLKKISADVNPKIIEGIRKVRAQEVYINPGFDGQYGEINILSL